MLKIGSAVAMGLLLASSALADEPGNGAVTVPEKPYTMQPMPVVCMTERYFRDNQRPSIAIWLGVTENERAQFTVYQRVEDGAWYLIMHTDNGLACVINGGPHHDLLGDAADAS